jgi:hypothetical protein
MEVFNVTRKKLQDERNACIRRVGLVVAASCATAAVGLLWPDSASAWGILRISVLGGAGAFAALMLTK